MGGSPKQYVTQYGLSLHYALCHGPIDAIRKIKVQEKRVTTFVEKTANGVQYITEPYLFGGVTNTGGIGGRVYSLLGGDTQTIPAELASKMGRTPETMSGYRDVASMFFVGGNAATVSGYGFYWSSNSPIVPPVQIEVQRRPIGIPDDDPMIGNDANPAHIICEALRNKTWGANYPLSMFDLPSFVAAAAQLRNENFGMSLIWTQTESLEFIVNEVVQTISASLTFVVPEGKWRLKLLRGGYDTSAIPRFNPNNAELLSFQRRGWAETINEIVVEFTNPENEETETVSVQDQTGFAIQDFSVSDASKNYKGIRSRLLALKVAERELRQASAPLASAEIRVDAGYYNVQPGDVVWFDWWEEDDDGEVFHPPMVCRVLKVTLPKKGQEGMTLSLLEDIFSLGTSQVAAQASEASDPTDIPADVDTYYLTTAPYFMIAHGLGEDVAAAQVYPMARTAFFAYTGLLDLRQIDVISELVTTSTTTWQEAGTLDEPGYFELEESLAREAVGDIPLPEGFTNRFLVPGSFLVIQAGSTEEWCEITAVTSTDVTVNRGMLDTVPHNWAAGANVWIITTDMRLSENIIRSDGATITYRLLPVTSAGRLDANAASDHDYELTERFYQPYRPANLKVGAIDVSGGTLANTATSFTVSWSNRNRVTETGVPLAWDESSVSEESGQTTTIRITRDSIELDLQDNLTGTSVVIDCSGFSLAVDDVLLVEAYSVRAGYESYQRAVLALTVT